jgi:hypothetical protein
MKQKFCHLLITLANVNCWVTYTNCLRNMEDHWSVENVLKVTSEVYNSIPVLCTVNDVAKHTVRYNFNTAYPHKSNLCFGRKSVWVEAICLSTCLVLYIVCHWSDPSIRLLWLVKLFSYSHTNEFRWDCLASGLFWWNYPTNISSTFIGHCCINL